jgi:hypothetical protein
VPWNGIFGIICSNLVYFTAICFILWWFGTLCGDLVHFVVIWYIPILVCCTKKNLATLLWGRTLASSQADFSLP